MMKNNTHLTRKTLTKRLLIDFAAIVVMGVCCALLFFVAVWYGEDIEDWLAVRETSRKLPEAEIRYSTMIEQIMSITEDDVLEEHIYSLSVPSHSYTHCINGWARWTYWSNRSYEEVVDDYLETFAQMGWEHVLTSEQHGGRHSFLTKTGTVRLSRSFTELELNSVNDQTIYDVDLRYAEPSKGSCSG